MDRLTEETTWLTVFGEGNCHLYFSDNPIVTQQSFAHMRNVYNIEPEVTHDFKQE